MRKEATPNGRRIIESSTWFLCGSAIHVQPRTRLRLRSHHFDKAGSQFLFLSSTSIFDLRVPTLSQKARKDGAPTLLLVPGEVKGWATRR